MAPELQGSDIRWDAGRAWVCRIGRELTVSPGLASEPTPYFRCHQKDAQDARSRSWPRLGALDCSGSLLYAQGLLSGLLQKGFWYRAALGFPEAPFSLQEPCDC